MRDRIVEAQIAEAETKEQEARRQATRFTEQADKARGQHVRRLRALEDVFGPAVRAAAEEHLETLTESSSEAIYFLERLVTLGDLTRTGLLARVERLEAMVRTFEFELDRVDELPAIMIERAERYFSATRRARPTWLREAVKENARHRAAVRDLRRLGEEPF